MGKEKRSENLLHSALAFLVLLIATNLWLNHLFDFGVESPGLLAGMASAAMGAMAILNKFLDKDEQKVVHSYLRSVFRFVLSFPFLAVCYLVFVIAALSFSTVRVTFNQASSGVKATLTPVDDGTKKYMGKETAKGMLRFTVPAKPLGRAFHLQVDGYMPETLTVYALSGLSIHADKDLRAKPVVLLRPTILGLRELEDGGRIVIALAEKTSSSGSDLVCEEYRGSFLLGEHKWIPAERFERWRLDLQMMDPGQTTHAKTLLEWSRPKILKPAWNLQPGVRLVAQIETKLEDVTERMEFTVGDEPFIDVLLVRQ